MARDALNGNAKLANLLCCCRWVTALFFPTGVIFTMWERWIIHWADHPADA